MTWLSLLDSLVRWLCKATQHQEQNQNRRGLPGSKLPSFASPKEGNRRKGDPSLPPLRGSLDQPQASGAAQLDLAGRTPRAPLRDSNKTCWLRHNLKVSLRRNKPLRGVLSPKPPLPCGQSRRCTWDKKPNRKTGGLCPPCRAKPDLSPQEIVRAAHTKPYCFSPERRRVAQAGQGMSARTV